MVLRGYGLLYVWLSACHLLFLHFSAFWIASKPSCTFERRLCLCFILKVTHQHPGRDRAKYEIYDCLAIALHCTGTCLQVAHLSLSGGVTTEQCVRRIMSRLLCNDLVKRRYTWLGRSEGKVGFSSLRLKCVVLGMFTTDARL